MKLKFIFNFSGRIILLYFAVECWTLQGGRSYHWFVWLKISATGLYQGHRENQQRGVQDHFVERAGSVFMYICLLRARGDLEFLIYRTQALVTTES